MAHNNLMNYQIFKDLDSLKCFYQQHDLYIFAYGSLLWNPNFTYQSSQIIIITGFYRDLCILATIYRGSRDKPGLVFGLRKKNNTHCEGKNFSVAENEKLNTLEKVWRREIIGDVYHAAVFNLNQKQILTFIVNTQSKYVSYFSKQEKLNLIYSAKGNQGSCLEYVQQTKNELKKLNIIDLLLEDLFI